MAVALLAVLTCSAQAGAAGVTNERPLMFSFDGSSSTAGSFANSKSGSRGIGQLAINDETGEIYVIDQTHETVDRFEADGQAQDFTAGPAAGTSSLRGPKSTESFSSQQKYFFELSPDVAVDNSGGAGGPGEGEQGRLYVSGAFSGVVDAFRPDGEYLWTLLAAEACGIAVDREGHLWVGGPAEEARPGEIHEFESSGSPPKEITHFPVEVGNRAPCALGVGYGGNDVYAALDYNANYGARGVVKYVGGGFDSLLTSTGTSALSVDQTKAAGDIFAMAAGGSGAYTESGEYIGAKASSFYEYEPCFLAECGGTMIGTFGRDLIGDGHGIAYDPASDRVYVADRSSGTVKVFGPKTSGPVPDVSCEATEEITRTEATARCTIDPEGLPNSYRLEWKQGTGTSWGAAQSSTAQSIEPSDTNAHSVSLYLQKLRQNSQYQVRLVAENTEPAKNGISAYSAPLTFTTLTPPPPAIEDCVASAVTVSSAHVACTLNPQEDETHWRILQGADPGASAAQCEALAESSFTQVAEGKTAPETTGTVAIAADLTGLEPAQTTCVRVIATNSGGTDKGGPSPFQTLAIAPSGAETAFASRITATTARVNGRVDPQGEEPLSVRFELSADGSTWTQLPVQSSRVPAWEAIVVAAEVSGLQPETTYHYRLASVEDEAGVAATVPGSERTFTTRPLSEMSLQPNAFGESERRGIELVNNPDDGNQNVNMFGPMDNELHGAITADGEKAVWEVFSGAPGAANAEYNSFLAQRSASGWSSRPIMPPAAAQYGGGGAQVSQWLATPDLSRFLASYSVEEPGIQLVRLDSSGGQQLLHTFPEGASPEAADMTDDGAHIVFENKEAGEFEEAGGASAEVISVMPDGSPAECGMAAGGISSEGISFMRKGLDGTDRYWRAGYHDVATTDGSRVYFQARPNGSGCGSDVPLALYVRDSETGKTTLIDPGSSSPERGPFLIRATPDGREAYFVTTASCSKYNQAEGFCEKSETKDVNEDADVYRWEEARHRVSCVTCEIRNESGGAITDADVSSRVQGVAISDDFSHVYFESEKALDPGAVAGNRNIYVLSDGVVRFVATVSNREVGTGLQESKLSANGRVLVFYAVPHPNLTADAVASQCSDPAGRSIQCLKLYRYEEGGGGIECLDCVVGGVSAHSDYGESEALSADGSTVAFSTPEALLPSDVNGNNDIYEWRNGALRLITDGVSSFPLQGYAEPHVTAMDSSGANIFFTLDQPGLTGFELSGFANAYDARIGGGFARPREAAPCVEDACQGPLLGAPEAVIPGSALLAGAGDVGPSGVEAAVKQKAGKPKAKRKRCGAGRVRRRVRGELRCVARKSRGHVHAQGRDKAGHMAGTGVRRGL
jgi:hypothetical protein